MSTDQISFSCDACGVQLTVPASLAGITGPCPSCQSSITAPAIEPSPPELNTPPATPEPQHELPPSAPAPTPQETAPEPAHPLSHSIPKTYADPSAIPPVSIPDREELSAPAAYAPAVSATTTAPDPYELPGQGTSATSAPFADIPPVAGSTTAIDPFESPIPPAPALEEEDFSLPKPLSEPSFPTSQELLETPLDDMEDFSLPKPPSPSAPDSAYDPFESPAPPAPAFPTDPAPFPTQKSPGITETPIPPARPASFPPPKPKNGPESPDTLSAPPAPAPAVISGLEAPDAAEPPKSAAITERPHPPTPEFRAPIEDDLPPVLLSNPIEPGPPTESAFPPPSQPAVEQAAITEFSAPTAPAPLSAMPGPFPAPAPTPPTPFPEARPTPQATGFPPSPPLPAPAPAAPVSTPTPLPAAGGTEDAFSKLIPIGAPAPAELPSPPAPGSPQGSMEAIGAPVTPPLGPLSPSDPPTISQPAPGPAISSGGLTNRTPEPAAKKRRLRWPGVVFPILFLLLAGIVVYLVLDLTGLVNSATLKEADSPELASFPAPKKPSAGANAKATPISISSGKIQRPKTTGIDQHDLNAEGELPPTPLIDLEAAPLPSSPSARVTNDPNNPSNILEKFLRANTLEQRAPYMSKSRLSAEELAASTLAMPLPEIVNRRSVHYMENRSERHKEHFFEVFFQMAPNERAVPILIQLNDWGDGKIMVHTDAFLDLFDDNIGKFAKQPVDGSRTFHVVADAYKHCFDDIIPDYEKKSVLKLRTHPRMAPRLIAYFNRNSAISDEISQPTALPWGESGICTVTVEWNTSTPDQPFVELRRIDGFTWNP